MAKQPSELIFDTGDASLLDIVDNVLNNGVVLTGDLTIALAEVDLIYARLSLLLCAADRVLPNESSDFMERHSRRYALRKRAAAGRRARMAAAQPRRRKTG